MCATMDKLTVVLYFIALPVPELFLNIAADFYHFQSNGKTISVTWVHDIPYFKLFEILIIKVDALIYIN